MRFKKAGKIPKQLSGIYLPRIVSCLPGFLIACEPLLHNQRKRKIVLRISSVVPSIFDIGQHLPWLLPSFVGTFPLYGHPSSVRQLRPVFHT